MINKLLKSLVISLFMVFGLTTISNAEMKCAPGKCGGQMMQDAPKQMKCGGAGKCDMKGPSKEKCDMNGQKCKNGKCDMKAKGKCNCDPKNCKCKDGKCDPKMKQKCADGKCPMQEPAKK